MQLFNDQAFAQIPGQTAMQTEKRLPTTWGETSPGDKFRVPTPAGLEPGEPGYGSRTLTITVVKVLKHHVVTRDSHGGECRVRRHFPVNPKAIRVS